MLYFKESYYFEKDILNIIYNLTQFIYRYLYISYIIILFISTFTIICSWGIKYLVMVITNFYFLTTYSFIHENWTYIITFKYVYCVYNNNAYRAKKWKCFTSEGIQKLVMQTTQSWCRDIGVGTTIMWLCLKLCKNQFSIIAKGTSIYRTRGYLFIYACRGDKYVWTITLLFGGRLLQKNIGKNA